MGQAEVNRRGFVRGIAGAAAAGLAAGEVRPRAHLLAGSTPSSGGEAWFVRNDPSWINRLSQPQYDIKFEFNVKKVRMRDGINLSANIWRPAAAGKFPVIYMHTSYDKSAAGMIIERAKYYVPRGYVFVAIDARGRHDSDGVAYFYWHENWREGKFEGQDVHDCLTWLGEQPWSTGKIGMTGPSGLAYYQWMGASLGNPYLTTIVPYVSPDDHYDNTFPNAAFHLTVNMHTVAVLGGSRTNSSGLETAFWDWEKLVWHLPLRTMDEAMLGKSVQLWQDFMDHPDNDYYWRLGVGDRPRSGEIGPGKYPQVKVPTLSITGWYDEVQQATINGYLGMRRYGPPELREKHHLVVGPWRHAVGHRVVGDLDFGPGADGDCLPEELHFRPYWLKPVEHRWFDYWLQGIDNGLMDESPVHVFRMGENAWRAEQEWPLGRALELKYYLHSSGHANSRFGDGTLGPEPPAEERTDTFIYDPADPMPSYGGIEPWQSFGIPDADGPRDQRVVNGRNDVLVYTSEPGQEDLEVTGRILCRLYAASTARDTDFTAKLADVHPDGYARILREGILRARYRNSFKKQELLRPGKVYEYVIDLWSVSHVFKKGHKVQVEISSSNFAKYDRNPNTGNRFGEDTELQQATQTIYHESRYPSAIILPVVQS